jgi:uncharacterized membrane protein YccC
MFPPLLLVAACTSNAPAANQTHAADIAAKDFRQCVTEQVAPSGGPDRVTGAQANQAFSTCRNELDRAANEVAKAQPNYGASSDNANLVRAAKQSLISDMTKKICNACLPPI